MPDYVQLSTAHSLTLRLSYGKLRGPQLSASRSVECDPTSTAYCGHLGDGVDDLQFAWLIVGWLLAFWAGKDLQSRFAQWRAMRQDK